MRILLIGNFAAPFEEENLHNITLLKKLEDDGHTCSVINTAPDPSIDNRFIHTPTLFSFVFKMLSHGWRKDVVHVSTKGYLRLGLLNLMFAVLIGTIYRAKTVITINTEFFTVQGQMRSPFGGTQTLHTAFAMASKIICTDRDTYDVASMYMKKPNFELVPSFINIPEELSRSESHSLKKLKDMKNVVLFSNVKYPSFIFNIINELVADNPFPSDVGIVISLSEKPSSKLKRVIEEAGSKMLDRIAFIENNDLKAAMLAYSKADTIIRPLTCDGITFFENFAIYVRKLKRIDDTIYFPDGLMFIKEGDIAARCVSIINTILCDESSTGPDSMFMDSYEKLIKVYKE
jgi:hypothetical protein